MMQDYEESKKPKLYFEGGEDVGEHEDVWKYTLDLSRIYNDADLLDFNNDLEKLILTTQDEIISQVGSEFYEKLIELVNNTKNTDSFDTIYDSIYDLCDEYDVKIEIK